MFYLSSKQGKRTLSFVTSLCVCDDVDDFLFFAQRRQYCNKNTCPMINETKSLLDFCLVINDCILRLNVKFNGLFYSGGPLLASLSMASNYSMKNSRLKAVYRCDGTADEAELSLVSGPWRQKLLTSADQDTPRASEYICNLKSAGTKSLSPLVVDFRRAKKPQIWGPTRREFSPPSAFVRTWILDKNLWRRRAECRACGDPSGDGGRTLEEERTLGNQ